MIDYQTWDFNIDKIKKQSNLVDIKTGYNYKIVGLLQEGNPAICIEYPDVYEVEEFLNSLDDICKFFKKHGIQVQTESYEVQSWDKDKCIKIGLRRDIRKHVTLSAATVNTIIFCLENQLNLNANLIGIPKFQ